MEWHSLAQSAEVIYYLLFGIVNLVFLVELYIDWRQHKAIARPMRPKELQDLCTEEEYLKSRAYNVDRSSFGLFSKICNHILSLPVLFAGIWPLVWTHIGRWMRNRCGRLADSEIIHSLLFLGLFLVIDTLQELPFSIYRTFVLEKKHGFNKTTPRTFFLDLVKSLCLTVVFGGIITAALLWVIMRTGEGFVVWTCGLLLACQLLMFIVYPVIIQPLFNKFTPLNKGPLRDKIEKLAKLVSFPLTKIFIVDGSKRSSHSNAYFFGLFKNKRIVLFDTLITQMEEDEILAIVGHELGHWAHNHILYGLAMSQLNIIWIFSLFRLAIGHGPLYEAFGFSQERPIIIGLSIFMQLMSPLGFFIALLSSWVSRRNEFQADRYAIDRGYGDKLPTALVKLYKENKSLVHPDPVYSMLHYSHPPASERISAMHTYSASAKKNE